MKSDKCARGKGSLWTVDLLLVRELLAPTKIKKPVLNIKTSLSSNSTSAVSDVPHQYQQQATMHFSGVNNTQSLYYEHASPITVLLGMGNQCYSPHHMQEISPIEPTGRLGIPRLEVYMPTRSISPDLSGHFVSKENIVAVRPFEWHSQ